MKSIFGIPVQWAPYTEAWISFKPGVQLTLCAPGEVFSQARKELVKTGHRVFGGKS